MSAITNLRKSFHGLLRIGKFFHADVCTALTAGAALALLIALSCPDVPADAQEATTTPSASSAATVTDTATVDSPVVSLKRGVKGCTVAVGFPSGDLRVFYEKAIVVGVRPHTDPDTDEAASEYWVWFPDRDHSHEPTDAAGRYYAVNIPQDDFLRDGEVVIHRMKVCRCPPFFWRSAIDNAASSAEFTH